MKWFRRKRQWLLDWLDGPLGGGNAWQITRNNEVLLRLRGR